MQSIRAARERGYHAIAADSREPYPMPMTIGYARAVAITILTLAMQAANAWPAFANKGKLYLCSGYSCAYKTALPLTPAFRNKLAGIMASGGASAHAERKAVSRAVQYFERVATAMIGTKDGPKGEISGSRVYGQMDCIDESSNTGALLDYLQRERLMRHHESRPPASRGAFIDGRYPHSTAVLSEKNGELWAVDSWYEPAGGAPDMMPLAEWRKRGVGGAR
ncbi:hypothetical protein [Nitratireductor luteus]|uniref:hypothetical protein n=1 Tax=Nitratireductor luteus TaxID=2976980 RepID=UPI00223F53E8|nr:hypothetical protein [Nitratireductor luteus]